MPTSPQPSSSSRLRLTHAHSEPTVPKQRWAPTPLGLTSSPEAPSPDPMIFGPLELDDFKFDSTPSFAWDSMEDLNSPSLGTTSNLLDFQPLIDPAWGFNNSNSLDDPFAAPADSEGNFCWSQWTNDLLNLDLDPTVAGSTSSPEMSASSLAPHSIDSVDSGVHPIDIRSRPRAIARKHNYSPPFAYGGVFDEPPSAFSLPTSEWPSMAPSSLNSGRAQSAPSIGIVAPQAIRPLRLDQSTFRPSVPTFPSSSFPQSSAHFSTSSASSVAINFPSSSSSSVPDDSRGRKRKRGEEERQTEVSKDKDKDKASVPLKSELHPPKQAPSAWQVFFTEWLQEHRTRYPHDKLNVAQAAKEAGQIYKNLPNNEKEEFKRRAQLAKEERERQMTAWKRTLTPSDIRRENAFRAAQRKAGKSRKGNIKDPNAPKKPLSAYFMFLAKIRADPALVQEIFGDETETTKQSKLAAAKWKEMSEAEKRPFLARAEQDKLEYEMARKAYEGTFDDHSAGMASLSFSSNSPSQPLRALGPALLLSVADGEEEFDSEDVEEDGPASWN